MGKGEIVLCDGLLNVMVTFEMTLNGTRTFELWTIIMIIIIIIIICILLPLTVENAILEAFVLYGRNPS